jgi:hypothetical protein
MPHPPQKQSIECTRLAPWAVASPCSLSTTAYACSSSGQRKLPASGRAVLSSLYMGGSPRTRLHHFHTLVPGDRYLE